MTRTASLTLKAICGAAWLFAAPALAQDQALSIFDWSGYEDPALNPAYAEQHGTSPTFTFFADEDEAFEKLRSGFKADISHPCSANVVKWRDAGLLQPLDTSRITAWKDILPAISGMKDLMTDASGTAWFVPFDWGNTLLTYRTDKVKPEQVASLRVFADPAFANRVTIPDNSDAAYALALLAVGVKDIQKITEEQFQAATAFLREVHPNVRLYWTDNTELAQALSSGEVDIAWSWNETANLLKANGVPVEVNRDTKEGIATWVCGYVHLKDAPGDPQKVYDFLNARLAPEVSNYMVTAWGYGHANGAGMDAIDADALKKAGFDDLEAMAKNSLFTAPMDAAQKQRFIAEFEKIKAGY